MDFETAVRLVIERWGISDLCARAAVRFVAAAGQRGHRVHLTSGYRSPSEQAALYAALPSGEAAPPDDSQHVAWPARACDFSSSPPGQRGLLTALAPLANQSGFTRVLIHRGTNWHLHCER